MSGLEEARLDGSGSMWTGRSMTSTLKKMRPHTARRMTGGWSPHGPKEDDKRACACPFVVRLDAELVWFTPRDPYLQILGAWHGPRKLEI